MTLRPYLGGLLTQGHPCFYIEAIAQNVNIAKIPCNIRNQWETLSSETLGNVTEVYNLPMASSMVSSISNSNICGDLRASTVVLLFILAFLLVHLFRQLLESPKGRLPLPPGPKGVPVLGYIPFMGEHPHLTLHKLAGQYGSIFQVTLGSGCPTVVVSDYQLLNKAWRKEEFAGRPQMPLIDGVMEGLGIVSAQGQRHLEQKRFVAQVLRKMGVTRSRTGRTRAQDFIESTAGVFVTEASKLTDRKLPLEYLEQLLSKAIMKSIFSVILGIQCDFHDLRLQDLIRISDEGFRIVGILGLLNFFPFLRFLWPFNRVYQSFLEKKEETQTIMAALINEQRTTMEPGVHRGLVDGYLQQMEEVQETGFFNEKQLRHIMGDLYSAGLETTKVTMIWTLYLMLKHPEIQAKVQAELDDVVGRDRQPSLDDSSNLIYTNAVVLEILRFSTVVPLGAPHAATEDTTLGGYFIAKGTHVMGQYHTIHRDPALWKNPEQFDPSHFINENGQLYSPPFFMPYSTGRRVCLGQEMSKMQIFCFFTHIMHNFNVVVPAGCELPVFTEQKSYVRRPPTFDLTIIPRSS